MTTTATLPATLKCGFRCTAPAAYNGARALPADLLASTPTTCDECIEVGATNLLECLNSGQAIICETAIEEVETLIAEHQQK